MPNASRRTTRCCWRAKRSSAASAAPKDACASSNRRVKSLDARGAGLWESFGKFASPKDALRRLPDRHPILLFPLRLETRFKAVGGQAQLWVRVYPDQCLAESFEPALTEAEARNAQIFWAGIWRAGGVDAEERSAWRDLASAHGVGRASWIVKHHLPLNTADQPQRNKPSDVLLVIVATTDAPAKTAEFWEKVWRAGGTEAAVVAARPALEQEVGAATAKRIVEEFTPVNLESAARRRRNPRDQRRKGRGDQVPAARRTSSCGARRGRGRRACGCCRNG